MVAQLLGLKLRLLANSFRRSGWQVFGLVIGLLYGAFVTVVIVSALVGARSASDVDLVRSVVVIAGSLTVLGFLILPLLFGSDDPLDPRRFALFGLDNSRLSAGLVIGALVGVPSLVLTLCALATIVTWSRNPGSTLLAVLSAVVAVLTCVLLARVTTSVAAFVLATRRSREFGGVIALLLIAMAAPVAVLLINLDWSANGLDIVHDIAGWLSWTPLGAVWAVPADAALGAWGTPVLKLLIALAFLGVLWLAWRALVARMLVTQERETTAKAHAGLGWFGTLPHGSAGAIAARSITYWARDSRYWVSLVMIPFVPVLPVIALIIAGVPAGDAALLPLPIMCLFLGWSVHNDVAYDSTAVWLHIVSGSHGLADRIGRLVPVLFIGIPLIAVGSIVTLGVNGEWSLLPAVIGVSSAVLLVGIGLSSLSSALFPYPATKPNDSPFAQPQNTGPTSASIQAFSFFAILVLSSPVVVVAVLGLMGAEEWLMGSLFVGLAIGLFVLVAGVITGTVAFNRRGPEIMAAAVRAD